MATLTEESGRSMSGTQYGDEKGAGWIMFAGVMMVMAGILNTIWGIAAISDSRFFVHDTHYVLSGLNTWGWITLILGVLEILAAFSIWSGGSYGRWFGIAVAGLAAIGTLMAIPAYPFWSLAVFALDVLVVYGLVAYGGAARRTA